MSNEYLAAAYGGVHSGALRIIRLSPARREGSGRPPPLERTRRPLPSVGAPSRGGTDLPVFRLKGRVQAGTYILLVNRDSSLPKVTAGEIRLNGAVIVGAGELASGEPIIRKIVRLKAKNELTVRVSSGAITVMILPGAHA